MPQLTWMGKDKVKNHHHHVPFHLLDKLYDFQTAEGKPANRRDNLLIHARQSACAQKPAARVWRAGELHLH